MFLFHYLFCERSHLLSFSPLARTAFQGVSWPKGPSSRRYVDTNSKSQWGTRVFTPTGVSPLLMETRILVQTLSWKEPEWCVFHRRDRTRRGGWHWGRWRQTQTEEQIAWMLKRHFGSLQIHSRRRHQAHGLCTRGCMTGATVSTTKALHTFLCSWVDVPGVGSHSCVAQ